MFERERERARCSLFVRGELVRTKPATVISYPDLQIPLQFVEVFLLGSEQGRLLVLVLAFRDFVRPFLGDRNVPAVALPITVGVFFAIVGDGRGVVVFFVAAVVK